ncbi:MAG: alkaline phosphatase family protein [Eubacteriales bacterium]|nr:alkaline phosphatase family protein [Eubacteriales bacterium]
MNNKYRIIINALIAMLLFSACSVKQSDTKTVFYNQLIITGDVETELILDMFTDTIPFQELNMDNETFLSFNLSSLLSYYDFDEADYDVLFTSNDGIKNKLSGGFEFINLYLSSTGWNVVGTDFPSALGLKNLKSIVLIKNTSDWSDSTNIITPFENRISLTPGKMHLMDLEILNCFEGTTTKNSSTMETYAAIQVLPLNKLIPIATPAVVMTRDGGYYPMEIDGYLQLQGNRLNYVDPNKRLVLFDVVGIIEQPPVKSIMDTYHDALQFIDMNERVMVIYIDGFSYGQYNYAVATSHMPFMSDLSKAEMAVAVFVPVTNSGMAAMLTGQPPNINGIKDRNNRNPKIETIFDYLISNEKSSMLIEGNASILNLNTNTVLNPDLNNNGHTDDEVFKSAVENMNGIDYFMVHFHGLDDSGHTYGDLASETMAKLLEIDSYVEALVSLWDGMVIITSDHGMHSTETGGFHGLFIYEDMIVPYIITEGGIQE